jgi:hypothetical protein
MRQMNRARECGKFFAIFYFIFLPLFNIFYILILFEIEYTFKKVLLWAQKYNLPFILFIHKSNGKLYIHIKDDQSNS